MYSADDNFTKKENKWMHWYAINIKSKEKNKKERCSEHVWFFGINLITFL